MQGYYFEGPFCEWDDERDVALVDKYKVWIVDRKETVRTFTPFDLWMGQMNYNTHAIPYAADYLSLPESRGFDWRLKDGWEIIGALQTTEGERRERELKFKEKIAPWIEDFGKEYHKGIDELMERHNRFKALEMENLEDWELADAFNEWMQLYRREAQLHFIWMYSFGMVYTMFEDMCRELLGIDRNDAQFNDLMGGFDHKILQTDREMFRLGAKARELGLEPIFKEIKDEEKLLSELELTEAGKKWLAELHKFLNEYGWRTIGNWDASDPTWVENPSLALVNIRRFMGTPTFAVDEARIKLTENRSKAEKEVLSRIPGNKKEEFTRLMRAAQWAGVCDEEHVFYTENYGSALGRYVTREIGRRFAKAGAIDDPQDIYYLIPEEIVPRIFAKYGAHKLVATRKRQHVEFRKAEPEPFVGDPTKVPGVIMGDPLLRTTVVPIPRVRPELNADLYGTVSTPGVVEGVVNLIMTEEEFDKFEPGSILVTIETSSAWTPLFNMAKAVVTDVGGILSHAAIIGREYGLPVVSGCLEGTKKLRTGMRVKVDGDVGAVYILEQ